MKSIIQAVAVGIIGTLVSILIAGTGCGGGGGDTKEAPETLTCVKDNVQYIQVDGEWHPWKNVEVTESIADEEGRIVAWMCRDIESGTIQIIADCGANVNLNISATDPTTNTSTNVDSNNDNQY